MNAQIRWSADTSVKILILLCVFILAVFLLTACSTSPVSTPTPETLESTETEMVPTATLEKETPDPQGNGNLTIIVTDTEGNPKDMVSEVNIFYMNELFQTGRTNEGIYMVGLPSGIYDIVLFYKSTQIEAQIIKDVVINSDDPNVIAFKLVPEGTLNVNVEMATMEKIPYDVYKMDIIEGDSVIIDKVSINSEKSMKLQSGQYEVSITCGGSNTFCFDRQTITHTIDIIAEKTTEEIFSLPYDVGILELSVPYTNSVKIIDAESSTTIYTKSSWSSYSDSAVLEPGKEYIVQVTADGKTQEQRITPITGETVKLTFE